MCECVLQHNRCTVGSMNWVPRYLSSDPAAALSVGIVGDQRRTALHEIMHLLGFENPLTGRIGVVAMGIG